MERIALVILNYLNFQDTIECINSIVKMNYELAGMVIVDNGSENESYKILKRLYRKEEDIYVVRTNKNYGYARGNNIGIQLARKRYSTNFVYIVNSDVIFEDPSYFKKLLCAYDKATGMIGSEIHLKDNVVQKKYFAAVSLKEVVMEYMRRWLCLHGKDVWINGLPEINESKYIQLLHGCGILFTPAYFEYYGGFYPKTFLYGEEEILYLICERYGLKQKYVKDTYIYHKEDQSSEMSFHNNIEVRNKFVIESYKYVVWWSFKITIYNFVKNILTYNKIQSLQEDNRHGKSI